MQANLSAYSLYTEGKECLGCDSVSSGVSDGIEWDRVQHGGENASDASQYENGKAVGNAEGLATVQADLASQGLSLLTYLNQMKVRAHRTLIIGISNRNGAGCGRVRSSSPMFTWREWGKVLGRGFTLARLPNQVRGLFLRLQHSDLDNTEQFSIIID